MDNNEVRRLDISKGYFETAKHKYTINDNLSVERFEKYEELQVKMGWGIGFKEIYGRLAQAIELGNKGKGVEAWAKVVGLRDMIGEKMDDKVHPALLICGLFFLREDENPKTVDEAILAEKIEDWRTEGFSVTDFFVVASNLVEGFIEGYQEAILIISDQVRRLEEMKLMVESGEEPQTK